MIDSHIFQIFGFALVVITLLFYVLCSKEAQIRLKPITFLARRRSGRPLPVHHWEEAHFAKIALRQA